MLVPTQQFPTLNIRWWRVKDKRREGALFTGTLEFGGIGGIIEMKMREATWVLFIYSGTSVSRLKARIRNYSSESTAPKLTPRMPSDDSRISQDS